MSDSSVGVFFNDKTVIVSKSECEFEYYSSPQNNKFVKLPFEGLDLFQKEIQKKAKLMLIVKCHLA